MNNGLMALAGSGLRQGLMGLPAAGSLAVPPLIVAPPSASTLALHLAADRINQASGDTVGIWYDASGSANNAVQDIAASKPAKIDGVKNNRPGMRFDGSSDYFTLTNNLDLSTASVYIAANKTGGSGFMVLLAAKKWGIYSSGTGSNWVMYCGAEGVSGQTLGSSHALLTFILRAANDIDLMTNAANLVNHTGGSFDGRSVSEIGGTVAASQYHTGDILELLVYPTAHSNADRDAVHAYLNSKWALY